MGKCAAVAPDGFLGCLAQPGGNVGKCQLNEN